MLMQSVACYNYGGITLHNLVICSCHTIIQLVIMCLYSTIVLCRCVRYKPQLGVSIVLIGQLVHFTFDDMTIN